MSLSEFRYNKKRKHYAYLFKTVGDYRKNILFSTKAIRLWKGRIKKNIKLYKHPNPLSKKEIYIIPVVYTDKKDCFYKDSLKWSFQKNDKRLIKKKKKKIKNRSRTHIN